jgi:hypothetical protein
MVPRGNRRHVAVHVLQRVKAKVPFPQFLLNHGSDNPHNSLVVEIQDTSKNRQETLALQCVYSHTHTHTHTHTPVHPVQVNYFPSYSNRNYGKPTLYVKLGCDTPSIIVTVLHKFNTVLQQQNCELTMSAFERSLHPCNKHTQPGTNCCTSLIASE